MELMSCLGPFPNWDSRYAVTLDLLTLFESEFRSKPNLVMYPLLFLFLFSVNVSKMKGDNSLITICDIYLYILSGSFCLQILCT